jgi:hypothetical protein
MAAQQGASAPTAPQHESGHRTTIAEYPTYGDAERAVEYLTDHEFPVERLAIVGTDVRMVEQIVGRVNYAGAALRGAGSGAFTGVLIGWLFGLFNWVAPIVASLTLAAYGLVIGAVLGAIFGLVAHALQRGRRDFASVRAMAPSRYQVVADADVADRARALLARMDGGH